MLGVVRVFLLVLWWMNMEGDLPDLPPVISLLSNEEFEPGFLDKTVSASEFFDLERWVSLHCYTMQF